jgi:glycosyltransferase involved in cell wall biosynthesis
MNLAFDSRACRDRRGIGRYARCLLNALRLDCRGEIDETHTPHPPRSQIYHSPWLQGALLRAPMPMVVTLHDLIPLKRRGEFLRSGVRLKMRYLAVQRAVRVIVPTTTVADDAVRMLGIPTERIEVIGEAPDPVFHPRPADQVASARERHRLPERYLLWVGSMHTPEPHKQLAALAKARRSMPLVLAGAASQWARELPDVMLTDQVSDDDLAAIYSGAHALVFLNQGEGFGLPLVEALACGTPVVAPDAPAVREVLDDRVELCETGDLDGLLAAAERARRPAPAPARWTWEDAAEATWDVYEDALRAPRMWRAGTPAVRPRAALRPRGL